MKPPIRNMNTRPGFLNSFKRKKETTWRCLSCGYLHTGTAPPDKCPACVKPQGYFELLYKNW